MSSSVMPPASADQALEMLQSAMGYLAAADPTAMTAEEQARCLRVLERATSVGHGGADLGAGRVRLQPGPGADAEYSPRAWLIHKTGVTRGAAMAYTAWVRRAEEHPAGLRGPGRRGAVRVRGQDRCASGPTSCRKTAGTPRTTSSSPPPWRG